MFSDHHCYVLARQLSSSPFFMTPLNQEFMTILNIDIIDEGRGGYLALSASYLSSPPELASLNSNNGAVNPMSNKHYMSTGCSGRN
jgi:hypothetical protein